MSSPELDYPPDPSPTRARFVVAAWLCGLAGILYLDRICMAQAVVPIQEELGLDEIETGLFLMAFTLAYGLFAVPAGWLGDRRGPRSALTGLVVAWSAFTALTGAATGLVTLIAVRFLFGAAEAGAFPGAAKVVARWFAVSERGRVQGVLLACSQLGAVVSPFVASEVIAAAGWRWMFVLFSLVGFAWAAGFWWWFRDDPAAHPGVNAAELAGIRGEAAPVAPDPGPVPWGAVVTSRGVLVLSLIMVLGAFYTYFFYSWFPKYLHDARGVENRITGRLLSLVIAGSAVGMLLGGWLADRIPRWTADPVRARRYLGVVCYLISAVCLFAGLQCDHPYLLACLWAGSFWAMHITLPNWWSCAIPQAGRHTATLFALMNGLGVFGALASQGFVAVFTRWQRENGLSGRAAWDPMFVVYVGVLLGGAGAWWLFRLTPLPEPKEDDW